MSVEHHSEEVEDLTLDPVGGRFVPELGDGGIQRNAVVDGATAVLDDGGQITARRLDVGDRSDQSVSGYDSVGLQRDQRVERRDP